MSDRDNEIEKNFNEWAREAIMNDQFVSSFSHNILENPVYTISDRSEQKKFYSAKQMLEMFRAGFLSMTKQEFDQKVFEKNKSRSESPFRVMKSMSVGSVRLFPYAKWNAARSAATVLKKQFGCVFFVTKNSDYKKIGDIKVVRIK